MKKLLLVSALIAGFSTVYAAPNTITFQGEVSEQTCSVDVNGNTDSPIVLLPTVSAGELSSVGSVAGLTTFTVSLTGCQAPASATTMGTVFIGNNVTANGNLGNTGTAQNVELQLLESEVSGSAIDLTAPATVAGTHSLAVGETSAAHDFAVQYYANGTAAAGTVVASVQYAVSYE